MSPICFRIGPFTAHWYGVMMALGFLAGMFSWRRLGRDRGWDAAFCADLTFWTMVSGILGARVVYVLTNLGDYAGDPLGVLRVNEGGLVFYGGFIGAIVAMAVFARRRGIRFLALLDFAATSLPLAHAFGRIGCFINGCCFGAVTQGFAGHTYPANSQPWLHHVYTQGLPGFAPRSLPVHPVQLYEAAFNLVLYGVLVALYRRKPVVGRVTAVYLVAYPVARFAIEFLRGDDRGVWQGVSQAQFVSVGLLCVGIPLLIRTLRRPAPRERAAETAGAGPG